MLLKTAAVSVEARVLDIDLDALLPVSSTGTTFSLAQKLSYRFDKVMRRKSGQAKFLVLFSLAFVSSFAAVQQQVNATGKYTEAVWEVWGMLIDPGQAVDESDGSRPAVTRVVASLSAIGGIMILAVLLGFIVEAIQSMMAKLKKGANAVVEQGHTLLLGYSAFSVDIILEICDANTSDGGGVIVVLTDRVVEDLEKEFHAIVPEKALLGSEVVFRHGNVLNPGDLVKVGGAHRALVNGSL
jgi:hypothetical protein